MSALKPMHVQVLMAIADGLDTMQALQEEYLYSFARSTLLGAPARLRSAGLIAERETPLPRKLGSPRTFYTVTPEGHAYIAQAAKRGAA